MPTPRTRVSVPVTPLIVGPAYQPNPRPHQEPKPRRDEKNDPNPNLHADTKPHPDKPEEATFRATTPLLPPIFKYDGGFQGALGKIPVSPPPDGLAWEVQGDGAVVAVPLVVASAKVAEGVAFTDVYAANREFAHVAEHGKWTKFTINIKGQGGRNGYEEMKFVSCNCVKCQEYIALKGWTF